MNTLMGAIAHTNRIEAVYRVDGGPEVGRKSDGWSEDTLAAAAALVDACAAELDQPVASVQLYTEITDPDGTAHSAPGELVDVTATAGPTIRIGDATAVPAGIADARDALKAAIQTEITPEE